MQQDDQKSKMQFVKFSKIKTYT